MKTTTFHGQKYICPTWDELGEEVFGMSKRILDSGIKFDRVVALAKGGLTYSRALVDYLAMKELSSIQIEFYTGIGEVNKTPVITQSLPISIRNQSILIFDEVVDSGESMKMAVQYLQYHGCKEVHTAAIASKPWSKFKVDFYGFETDTWIIFPHEKREMINLLQKMWQKKGDSPAKIKEQLIEVGLPKEEVEYFLKIK